MAGKRKATSKMKKTSAKRTKRVYKKSDRKTKTTKGKSTKTKKTLSKKFSSYNKYNKPVRNSTKSMQPKPKPSVSANAADVADRMIVEYAKKYKFASDSKAADAMEKKRRRKAKRIFKELKKVGKGVGDVVKDTGKYLDKFGEWSEGVAPYLTEAAIANPEMPLLAAAAGITDVAAMGHRSYHAVIDKTVKALPPSEKKPGARPADIGIKQLTDSNKYQKLMSDVRDPNAALIPYGPLDIDLPPVEDDDI